MLVRKTDEKALQELTQARIEQESIIGIVSGTEGLERVNIIKNSITHETGMFELEKYYEIRRKMTLKSEDSPIDKLVKEIKKLSKEQKIDDALKDMFNSNAFKQKRTEIDKAADAIQGELKKAFNSDSIQEGFRHLDNFLNKIPANIEDGIKDVLNNVSISVETTKDYKDSSNTTSTNEKDKMNDGYIDVDNKMAIQELEFLLRLTNKLGVSTKGFEKKINKKIKELQK